MVENVVERNGNGDTNWICEHEPSLKCLARRVEELGIRGRIETISTTAVLRSAWMLRSVLEAWKASLSLSLQWKSPSVSDRENLNNNNNDNN